MKKKPSRKKKPTATTRRKPAARSTPHTYTLPKTAAELGITCGGRSTGAKCGRPAIWFDNEIGEKNHRQGFVCDAHKVSRRVEKLAMTAAREIEPPASPSYSQDAA